MQGGHYEMRWLALAQLQDQFGQIGLVSMNAGSLKRGIQLNLGRGHGFDLDDLVGLLLA